MLKQLTEYLKLVPQGLLHADKLVEGVVNQVRLENGTLPEALQEEIIRRRLICATCPFMSENAKNDTLHPYHSNREDQHCIHCGCPIKTRTAALSYRCGIERYNQRHPEAPLALKWEEYKPKPTENNEQTH